MDISKKGWERVEAVYGTETVDEQPLANPRGVIRHQVFEEADYSKLGIGN